MVIGHPSLPMTRVRALHEKSRIKLIPAMKGGSREKCLSSSMHGSGPDTAPYFGMLKLGWLATSSAGEKEFLILGSCVARDYSVACPSNVGL